MAVQHGECIVAIVEEHNIGAVQCGSLNQVA